MATSYGKDQHAEIGHDGSNFNMIATTGEISFTDTVKSAITLTQMLNRTNHTGTQTAATISDFDTAASASPDVAANTTHRSSDGTDHSAVVTNTAHTTSDGTSHSTVVSNAAHTTSDGSSHSAVAANTAHTTSDGTSHSTVVSNAAHVTSDGSSHSAVVANTAHSTGSGSDHSDVAANTAHTISDGSSHSYIDQDVTTTAIPTHHGISFLGGAVTSSLLASIGDSKMYFVTTSTCPLYFGTNDVWDRMILDTSGNLGVGAVPSGSYKLEVGGAFYSSAINSGTITSGTGDNTSQLSEGSIELSRTTGAILDFKTATLDDFDCRITASTDMDLIFNTGGPGGATPLVMDSAGRIGIDADPEVGYNLKVYGSAKITSNMEVNGSVTNTAGSLTFQDSATGPYTLSELASGGGTPDKIEEGDSYFEVIDTGSDGHYIGELDGSVALYIDDTKVAIGDDVVYSGTNAIAIGENASAAGNYSIAIGETSSASSTYALAIGGHATSPVQTISIGYSAGPSADGSNSVCIGHQAGDGSTDPDRDVAIGYRAGLNSVFNDSVLIGSSCGSNLDADDIVCIGGDAGTAANNSDKSVFIGRRAGDNAADASQSVFLGYRAGYDADSSSGSVYIGYNSGASTNTTYTVCVGDQSGNAASGSGSSTFVGASAGSNATNANNSVFMGYYAGYNADNSNASVFIGYRAGQAFSSHANTLIIENSDDVINPLVYGEFGTSSTNKLCINTATAATSGAGLTVNGALILQNGTSIDEFSTDDTLGDNSDTAVPTEKAVRTYVDTQVFGSSGILQKIVNIGDWNMDTSIGVSVTFPGDVTFSKVIGIRGMIRNDDSTYLSAVPSGGSDCDMDVTFSDITSSTIILYRRAGGQFDNTSYDSTSFNRGWIIIDYTL